MCAWEEFLFVSLQDKLQQEKADDDKGETSSTDGFGQEPNTVTCLHLSLSSAAYLKQYIS
jgi:hypothetical protein